VERLTGVRGLATKILSSIGEATQLAIPVKVNVTATQWNADDIPRLVEELAQRGVQEIATKNYIPAVGTPVEVLSLSPEQHEHLGRELGRLSAAYASRTQIVYEHISPEQHDRALLGAYLESLKRNGPVTVACKSGYSEMTIALDGSVLLCEQMPEPVFGRLATQSVQAVWETCYIDQVRNSSNQRRLCAEECQSCSVFDQCGYRTSCYARTRIYKQAIYGAAESSECSFRRVVRQHLAQQEKKKKQRIA